MIIVTGASGLLGSNLLLHLLERGMNALGLYHNHPLTHSGLQVDLTDRAFVENLLERLQPRWIIHCAAVTDVDWCEQYPEQTYLLNATVPEHLAQIAQRLGIRMVYVSTDSVFDGIDGYYGEEDLTGPLNVYAQSKLAGEQAVLRQLQQSLILRTNIYGWTLYTKRSLAEWILSRLETGQDVPGFYDVTFAPILVNDLSAILCDMLSLLPVGVYHVNGVESCSKYEFAVRLATIFGFDVHRVQPVSVYSAHFRARRPQNTALRTIKISKMLGRSMPDIDAGLVRFKALRDSGVVFELKALAKE